MLRDQAENSPDMKVLNIKRMEDLDGESIRDYRIRYNTRHDGTAWTRLSDDEFLVKIGAASKETEDGKIHPTAAGLLMFGQEYLITPEFPEYFLDYREKLDPSIRWTDRVQTQSGDWSGNVFDFFLEITESAYTEDSEQIVENVKKRRDAGFLIEMDDFGSGYSSLNMISTLPIDVIKLDMQFIRNAFRGHSDTRMLEAVLGIAEMLYLPTVAEGVETADQMNALKGMGCDVIQGYYFSKPVPSDEYETFIEDRLSIAEDIASAEHSHHKPRLSYEDHKICIHKWTF